MLPGILFNTMTETLLPDRIDPVQSPREFFNESLKVMVKDLASFILWLTPLLRQPRRLVGTAYSTVTCHINVFVVF